MPGHRHHRGLRGLSSQQQARRGAAKVLRSRGQGNAQLPAHLPRRWLLQDPPTPHDLAAQDSRCQLLHLEVKNHLRHLRLLLDRIRNGLDDRHRLAAEDSLLCLLWNFRDISRQRRSQLHTSAELVAHVRVSCGAGELQGISSAACDGELENCVRFSAGVRIICEWFKVVKDGSCWSWMAWCI
jgi:hypothetical protein